MIASEVNISRPQSSDTTIQHEERMHIDRVLASQPEIGPAIPDGGYGWVILAASIYLKHVIPSLLIALGVIFMFTTIETAATIDLNLWSNDFIYTPLLHVAVQILSDPLSYLIIRNSKWPRFVSLCGVCLICASILILWLSVIERHTPLVLKMLSGILAGMGTSLIMTQIDILLAQYFKLKLTAVQNILRVSECCGFIYTCLLLGKYLNMNGVPHTIIWYHLVILLSGLVVLFLKKPDYLKGKSIYNVIRHRRHSEDDEDIFTNTRELQSPHTSLAPVEPECDQNIEDSNRPRNNWVQFHDENETTIYDNELATPRELFAESQINNNVTYSFDSTDTVIATNTVEETANIFLPVPKASSPFEFLKKPPFYKTCIFLITINYTSFVFFILFPSYIYFTISNIHKESVTQFLSIIFLAILLEALLIFKWEVPRANRAFFIAIFAWINALGNFLIAGTKAEPTIAIGGILVITSLYALKFIAKSLATSSAQAKLEYTTMKFISGFSFIIFLLINPSYRNCFGLVGLLQFSCGSIWFCNFVYKKILLIFY